MKKPNLLFPIVILLLLIVSVSCKDENEPTQPENTVKDIDGNIYKTVKIGDQVWMAENLKVTHYRNGEEIVPTDSSNYHYLYEGSCYDYAKKADNSLVYGKLYNWYAISDSRKIAPAGWHVPTNDEWLRLICFLGGTNDTVTNMSLAGGKLKEANTEHWNIPNTGATDDAGFTALPGGYFDLFGSYERLNYGGYWWSSDEKDLVWADGWYIYTDDAWIRHIETAKMSGYSVRCVKD